MIPRTAEGTSFACACTWRLFSRLSDSSAAVRVRIRTKAMTANSGKEAIVLVLGSIFSRAQFIRQSAYILQHESLIRSWRPFVKWRDALPRVRDKRKHVSPTAVK